MKFRKYINPLIIFLLIAIGFYAIFPEVLVTESYAATSYSSSKKSKYSSKKRTNKKSRRKKSRRGSSRTKTRSRKVRTKSVYKAPVETPSNDSLTLLVNTAVIDRISPDMNPGGLRINKVTPDSRRRSVRINLNENFTFMPVTREMIDKISRDARAALPDSIADYSISLNVGQRNLAYYINHIDKLPEKYRTNVPFVTAVKPYVNPVKGMEGDIVALWHSHGKYFKGGGWQWQRGLLFQSLEDTYTMGYVLPYLVPMLENAGAYVLLPRERDYNRHEVIVDNDTNDGGMLFSQTTYKEKNGVHKWSTGEFEGFIYDLPDFRDTENPFENGTYREVVASRGGTPSVAAWYADIPEDGEYAVYVSYKSLPNSVKDARYTVNYSGGSREFKVNQTMGGGTWIYLGTFPLEEGFSDTVPVVTLTNHTDKSGEYVVTADAVKIGGGMGNIARSSSRADIYYDPSTPAEPESVNTCGDVDKNADITSEETDDEEEDDVETEDGETDESVDETSEDVDEEEADSSQSVAETPVSRPARVPSFCTSGVPRYLEGARYWLHWAGFPEKIYSPFHGANDYKDDYTCRGMWVNYLAGGSRALPGREGLGIPVDISFALHSDAGKRADDSIIGTLGIYYTNGGDCYADSTPRSNSRMLTDLLMRQITNDVRRTYEPRWTRRSMWDKSYLESRVAEVPTTLLELLSHQNFGDMQYGLDPNFKFVVSRAIYKAMARFIAERKDREVVIQPLPVHDFAISKIKRGHYRLSWQATPDTLEPTAMPKKYIIMERTEGTLGFHKAGETASNYFDVKVTDDLIHSYRVIAANSGGLSFPSEILALRDVKDGTPVLIVNGFDRVSAPAHFSADGRAGFKAEDDFGVPYINDASFTGYQTEFRRNAGESFGRSSGSSIGVVVAGNTFDYPALHGDAVSDAGHGFVSVSAGALNAGKVNLQDYHTVDYILGKQKLTTVGRGTSGLRYEVFPNDVREYLEKFVRNGGNLIVSGAYVASDLFDQRADNGARDFAENVLGIRPAESAGRSRSGKIVLDDSRLGYSTVAYSNTVNADHYIVENPDRLEPAGESSRIVARFSDTDGAAGIITQTGKGKVTVFSIPFEAIKDEDEMKNILKVLTAE